MANGQKKANGQDEQDFLRVDRIRKIEKKRIVI
jgi:hypothetical protein